MNQQASQVAEQNEKQQAKRDLLNSETARLLPQRLEIINEYLKGGRVADIAIKHETTTPVVHRIVNRLLREYRARTDMAFERFLADIDARADHLSREIWTFIETAGLKPKEQIRAFAALNAVLTNKISLAKLLAPKDRNEEADFTAALLVEIRSRQDLKMIQGKIIDAEKFDRITLEAPVNDKEVPTDAEDGGGVDPPEAEGVH